MGQNNMNERQKPSAPIVVDLGSASRKRIREFERGTGGLELTVEEILGKIRTQLAADAENKALVPIVAVYSRKSKRRRSLMDLILDSNYDDDDDDDDDE